MDTSLNGKVAIVTGAMSGVARGIASTLVAEGARVAVVARDATRIQAVVEQFEAEHGKDRAFGVSADVSSAEKDPLG